MDGMPEGSEPEAMEVEAKASGEAEAEREAQAGGALEGQAAELETQGEQPEPEQPEPEQPALEQPAPEPEREPASVLDEDGEPGRLDAAFEIRVGFGGQPTTAAATADAATEFALFYVQVNDDRSDRPRSVTVWRLGSAADDDRGVSRAVLHGCSACMCDSASDMPTDAFEVRLAADDEGVAKCYYFTPVAHQSAADLVDFFNECGSRAPANPVDESVDVDGGRLRQTEIHQRQTRAFEMRISSALEAGPTPRCKKAEVYDVEEQTATNGATVMVYQMRCTALFSKKSEVPPPTWELSKLFQDFVNLRQQLVQADKASQADPLDVWEVPFPPQLHFWSRGEDSTVAAIRRLELQAWINKMIFLNNTLVTSGHLELDAIILKFLQPQTAAQRQSVATEGSALAAADAAGSTNDGDWQDQEFVDSWREHGLAQGFAEPSTAELNAEGQELVGRRVFVCGHRGPGVITAFDENMLGASSHVIQLDGQEATTRVKLARKTNTDAEKRPWLVIPRTSPGGDGQPAEGVPPGRRTITETAV
eukprot:COSAG02_NODE_2328_length_9122_cov_7.787100_2_plen_535_part_00